MGLINELVYIIFMVMNVRFARTTGEKTYFNYIILCGGIIKIGRTANVNARLSELSFRLGIGCTLYSLFSYPSRQIACIAEKKAHEILKPYQTLPFNLKFGGSSEFFNVEPS
ncbi:GIY-YIG nuclease family protein, partial [Salmonella enterica]|nr:GIY-YIG nuclease family protein [Salmonella enterica]